MKKFFLSLFISLTASISFAQSCPSPAPDATQEQVCTLAGTTGNEVRTRTVSCAAGAWVTGPWTAWNNFSCIKRMCRYQGTVTSGSIAGLTLDATLRANGPRVSTDPDNFCSTNADCEPFFDRTIGTATVRYNLVGCSSATNLY